jgi:hypothetical protein
LQTVFFQKLAVCRKMYGLSCFSMIECCSKTHSVIAAGCKEPTEKTSAPHSIGAVPNTLMYCKLFCAKDNLWFVSGRGKKISFCRWEDNIKMDLQEVGGGGCRGDWMEFAQDRDRWRVLVGTVRDFRVP